LGASPYEKMTRANATSQRINISQHNKERKDTYVSLPLTASGGWRVAVKDGLHNEWF